MDALIRFGLFLVLFAGFAVWEALRPARKPDVGRRRRWPVNLGILLVDAAAIRLLAGIGPVLAAAEAAGAGWGLFNRLDWPFWIEAAVCFVLLDLAVYAQHRLSHGIPLLWRIHRVHHTDLDLDVTSAVRFHPVEIVLSLAYKAVIAAALGAHPAVVLAFEAALNGGALFNHANLTLPPAVERALRRLIVTPDMHRIHHSAERSETDSNFGFFLSFWDRVFGSYRHEPAPGFQLGLSEWRDPARLGLGTVLLLPFRAPSDTSPNPGNHKRPAD